MSDSNNFTKFANNIKQVLMAHLYIFGTILLTVTSQLIMKWRMSLKGAMPEGYFDKIIFLLQALFDPFVFISIVLTFLGGLSWMAAMTKFDISYAYPFISLSFILILVLSPVFFTETITTQKVLGLIFIIVGIIISSRS